MKRKSGYWEIRFWGKCFIGLWMMMCHHSFAQDSTLQQSYQQQSIEQHAFNHDTWKKATDGLDYSDKRKAKPEKEEVKNPEIPKIAVSEQTLRLIAFVVLFAILIIILLKAFGVNIALGKKKKTEEKKFTVDEFDDHIPESELDRFLREALLQKDYKLAVRIYYLMAIKELSVKKLISWRKEKTNFDYLTELREADSYREFREVTQIFERVWYGERSIDEHHFGNVSTRFKNFLAALKTSS